MGSRGVTVVQLRMTPYFWRLLGKYCIILSCETMASGGRRMSLAQTVTGIVASHLARHAQWIEDEFTQIIREVAAQASGFPSAYVDAVASATSEQIPDVVRAGTNPKRLAAILKRVRPLLHLGGPARIYAGRPTERPKKVRDGGVGAPAVTRFRVQDPSDPELGGDDTLRSGDAGPQPELLEKALREFGRFLETEDAQAIIQGLEERRAKE